ncbi:ABC-type transport system involved in multi-copper enzyme maturation permease subunit [Streptomyces aurantiacus]|uniref:ABC transporter permease subunit n=1 Tax=Streptomyces aurantiacus TaxID=47760 RepID=UPI002794E7D4|nr:ABC transporter permease subunit [Streptomyces aurantiacus]MDQ0774279.1 ABC-type transport system involved in multi-copper enzyme maturation permease subunit [Streptomyces aurantiacus]
MRLLRAEWSKFWTVRSRLLVLVLGAAATVVISLLGASGAVNDSNGRVRIVSAPDGTRVDDTFRFVHRPLTGDGSVTVHVPGIEGRGGRPAEPWAKAGVIVKSSTKPGSSYVALMVTPGHGVRMQWDFTHDEQGSSATARWLRLTRSGQELTGYESPDGREWTKIATVRPADLPKTARAGLFVATPPHTTLRRSFGGTSATAGTTTATAAFDHTELRGDTESGGGTAEPSWTSTDVGAPDPDDPNLPKSGPARPVPGSTKVTGDGGFTVTGQGDIAPTQTDVDTVQMSFQGVFVGVLFMVALGALFITAEYRRGMIRTTFTASPRREQVLAAKVLVIGGVTFAAGLVAAALAFPLAQDRLRSGGFEPPAFPEPALLEGAVPRAVVGSALLLSLAAVLALAVGAVLRSSAGAITAVVVLVILPQILAFALPLPAAEWLLRLTPAAAFAIQQGVTHYPQVDHDCLPETGCYPLAPWHGLAVLCAYVAVALALAAWRLRRRDA